MTDPEFSRASRVSSGAITVNHHLVLSRDLLTDFLVVAPPGTHFEVSSKGWINHKILCWLDFFIKPIPSARPILLLYEVILPRSRLRKLGKMIPYSGKLSRVKTFANW